MISILNLKEVSIYGGKNIQQDAIQRYSALENVKCMKNTEQVKQLLKKIKDISAEDTSPFFPPVCFKVILNSCRNTFLFTGHYNLRNKSAK